MSPTGSSVHGDSLDKNTGVSGMSFSRGSFQPRDQTHVSYISSTGRQILYHWPMVKGKWKWKLHAAAAKSLQSCPTLCDPIDRSPAGSAIPGILQARSLEWVANSFSNAWKWKVKVKSLSRVHGVTKNWTGLCNFRRRQWHSTPVLLPRKSHGGRSLVGYSPWGH